MATERKKNALSNSKLSLSAPCPTAKGSYSQLRVDIYNNNPRIVVRTNDPADRSKSFGQITAALDGGVFFAFLQILKNAIEAPGEFKEKVECHNHVWKDNQRSKDITHVTDLLVGKDREGVVWISVVAKDDDRPVIKFPFSVNDNRYHRFVHGDGTPYTKAELSVLTATGFYHLMTQLIPHLMVTEYVAPQPPAGGNNRGNYQNAGNSNAGPGRASKPADDYDADINF